MGVDSDSAMIERARSEHPGIDFLLADGQQLSADGRLAEPFDAVLSNAALHWMPDQSAAIRGVASLLRPGGRFVAEQGGIGNVRLLWHALEAGPSNLGLRPADSRGRSRPQPNRPSAGRAGRLHRPPGQPVRASDPTGTRRTAASWVEMFCATWLPEDAETRADLLARDRRTRRKAGLQGELRLVGRLRPAALRRQRT